MNKKELTEKMMQENYSQWVFICDMLDKNEIEEVISEWEKAKDEEELKMEDPFIDLIEEEEDEKIPDHILCMNILMRHAEREMFSGISEDQAYKIMRCLETIEAQGITMKNGINYSFSEFLNLWCEYNRKD